MTRSEFKKRLGQMREALERGSAYYTAWKCLRLRADAKVSWSLEDQNNVLGRYRGFFTPAAFALLDMALIEFAKLFDTNVRTASLTNLLRAARLDATLVPHTSPIQLREVSDEIKQSRTLLRTLKQTRNQHLAHLDANPDPRDPLMTQDFDQFIAHVQTAFNTLSGGHDKNVYSFEYMLRDTERHTTEVLEILLHQIGRARQEHEDEMVHIGLEQLRRTQASFGPSLDDETVREVIGTLGLTETEFRRVEEAYHFDRVAKVSS